MGGEGRAFKRYLARGSGVLDGRKEVRHIFLNNLFHEVGHLYTNLNE